MKAIAIRLFSLSIFGMLEIKKCLLDSIQEIENNNLGLMLGNTGIALFIAANNQESNKEIYLEKIINSLINDINKFPNFSLSNGITGFAFLNQFLIKKKLINDSLTAKLDSAVSYGYKKFLPLKEYDYLHGYLGIINFFSYSNLHEKHKRTIEREFSYLLDFLSPSGSFPIDRELNSSKFLANFGLAHGIPSFLSILINYNRLIENPLIVSKIKSLTEFILSQKIDNINFVSRYPSSIYKSSNTKRMESRLAWCYGDLGVNLVLLKAAKYLKNKQLENEVLKDLVHLSFRKKEEETYIIDCCFCHGAAGLVYIFKYLYSLYNLKEFKETFLYWESYILSRFNRFGLLGLSFHLKSTGWLNEKGLLEGHAGIYLALFKEEFDDEVFNKIFLIDVQ